MATTTETFADEFDTLLTHLECWTCERASHNALTLQ